MARGFRMGGAGASVAPVAATQVLFSPNDEHSSVTGGYANVGGTFTKGSTLKISSSSGWAYAVNQMAFDVTPFKKLVVTYRGSNTEAFCGLVSSKGGAINVKYQRKPTSTTVYETVEWDITDEIGWWYFQMQAFSNCFIEISSIELTGGDYIPRITYLAPLNTLALTTPSNTASSTSTKRTWSKNSYIKDLFSNNTYYAGTVQNNSVILTENSVKFTCASNGGGYGVGFVLNDNVITGKTYEIDVSYSNAYSTPISILYYQSDGTFISNHNGTTFTVPSNTAYTIVLCRGLNSTQATFTFNSITEATT